MQEVRDGEGEEEKERATGGKGGRGERVIEGMGW